MQQASDEDFGRQIFRVLKMDASVPVDIRVFMQKRAQRKYLADNGLTDVVKPGGQQYMLKHGKVLVEATAAGIEPLECHRKVEREKRFNLVVHDPDALFNIIDQHRRDQAVIEANDAARRQTATRRDARSVAAAGTKLQSSAADEHDASQSAKTAGVKAERNRRYDNNECVCQARSPAVGLLPEPAGQGAERRTCPEPRPRPQAAAAAAAIHMRSCEAYPEKNYRDGPCVCHPYGWG